MDFSLPVLSLSVQVTLLVSQHKDHSRRGHNAAAAITLSPLKAEGNRVRGKVNTAFAVPYHGSCHQCRAFWCTCLRTRLPFFKSPQNKLPVLNKGSWRLFSEGEDLLLPKHTQLLPASPNQLPAIQSALLQNLIYPISDKVIPVSMSCFHCTSLQEVFGC